MWLIWGVQQFKRKRGWVADYCPFCDEVRPCRLTELRQAPHLYFVSIGKSKLLGGWVRCRTCRQRHPTDIDRYPQTLKKLPDDLNELVRHTQPDLPDWMMSRMARFDALLDGTLTPSERQHWMLEPFEFIEPCMAEEDDIGPIRGRELLWMPACVAVPVLVWLIADDSGALRGTDWPLILALGSGIVPLGGLIRSIVTLPRRRLRRRFFKFLARCLDPLDPSLEELQALRARLKKQGSYAAAFDPQALHQAIIRHHGALPLAAHRGGTG